MVSRVTLRALATAAAVLVGACSSSDTPGDNASGAPVAAASAKARVTTTTAAPTTTTTEPPRPLTLPERLDAIVDGLSGRNVAVTVVDASGDVVLDHRADAAVIPASTAKLATAAAALARLSPEFRWVTRVASTAPLSGGVVDGDVVVIGAGDPTLSGGRYAEVVPERPRTALEALAERIAAAGVTRITGRLVADAAVFPHQPFADGLAHTGGDSSPPSSGLAVDGGRRVWFDGTRVHSVPAADPAQEAASLLAAALAVRGITVDGGAHHADGAGAAAVHPLGEVVSPPLVDVLAYLVQRSDNHLADAVFRTIGAAGGDATWAGAARHATEGLARLGVDTAGFVLADGSGLSRLGRVTPRALVDLDELMTRSPFAAAWSSFYAVAGASGTLRSRLAGTPAAGRVAAKTGSLRDVRALTGYVTDGAVVRFRFSVVGNDLDQPGLDAVERAQDDIALALAERAVACAGRPDCPPAGP